MIPAGEFNCVITNDECTGQRNFSRALARLIQGLDLIDVWEATPTRTAYTHYTDTSRIDRIYVTDDLRRRQQGAETVGAAFTDHFTVILRLTMDVSCSPRGKWYWRMNVSFLNDPAFLQTTKENWEEWRTHMKCYPNGVMWRCRYVKRTIRLLFSREGADRRRDRIEMENFYYSAIYSALQDTTPQTTQAVGLKELKAKIMRLNSKHHLGMFIDNGEQKRVTGEEPSLHHLLKIRKRQAQRRSTRCMIRMAP